MAGFVLYCDDSGTHEDSPFAIAACYVATPPQWEQFTRNWQEAAEGFGVFHMADFVAKQKQFSLPEWQDEGKRNRTLKRLITIISTRRRMGFSAAVDKRGYDAEVPVAMRQKHKLGNNHYSFAVRMCMAKVLKWRLKYKYTEPVEFGFDQMSKGRGEINAIFEEALREGDDAALIHGISTDAGWSFHSKKEKIPLQGADILAWEALYHMRKVFLDRRQDARRRSFEALLNGPMDPGYHDTDSLRAWVEHVRRRTRATW
jgi:hypothetical protein